MALKNENDSRVAGVWGMGMDVGVGMTAVLSAN